MYCGRCCVMEPRSRAALQLDIFIVILLRASVIRLEENSLEACVVPLKRCRMRLWW